MFWDLFIKLNALVVDGPGRAFLRGLSRPRKDDQTGFERDKRKSFLHVNAKGEGIRVHYELHVSRTAQRILDLEELVSGRVKKSHCH
jgi:hypothetical protein